MYGFDLKIPPESAFWAVLSLQERKNRVMPGIRCKKAAWPAGIASAFRRF
jgi:hypothetical protein